MNYPVYPCGIASDENDTDFMYPFMNGRTFKAFDVEKEIENRKKKNLPYFSFLDKEHIY
jgi:hypothetical protein